MTKVKMRYAKRVKTLVTASNTELMDELMKRILKVQPEALYIIDQSTANFKAWALHSNEGILAQTSFK